MKKLALLCSAAVAAASFSTVAEAATVYTGLRTVGAATAQLSITTDDTIGVLTGANILDWTIVMNQGGSNFTLFGPLSGNNSQVLVSGSALSATSTDLLFDFGAASGFALFQAPTTGSGQTFYCVQIDGCFDFNGPAEAIDARDDFAFTREARQGRVVLASAGAGAVPEPATWAMLVLGFGAAGGAMRARRKLGTTVSYA